MSIVTQLSEEKKNRKADVHAEVSHFAQNLDRPADLSWLLELGCPQPPAVGDLHLNQD